jgi:hypothetical protein
MLAPGYWTLDEGAQRGKTNQIEVNRSKPRLLTVSNIHRPSPAFSQRFMQSLHGPSILLWDHELQVCGERQFAATIGSYFAAVAVGSPLAGR